MGFCPETTIDVIASLAPGDDLIAAPSDLPTKESWYAVRVKSRYEKLTSMMLESKGYEKCLPLYRSKRASHKRVELPLFPGYVFCRFDVTARLPILMTPGVLYVVGCGRLPIPIKSSEMEAIRRLAGSTLPSEPWPYLEAGQEVCVEHGPLAGVAGKLVAVKKRDRLVLSVTLLKRAVAVEIDREWVTPLRVAHAAHPPDTSCFRAGS